MEISSDALYHMALNPPPSLTIPAMDTSTPANKAPTLLDDTCFSLKRNRNKHCTVCDGKNKTCGYTFMRKKKVAERVRKVVGAVANHDPHPHTNFICRECLKELEKIEKCVQLKTSFVNNYWETCNQYEKQHKISKFCLVCTANCISGISYTITQEELAKRICKIVGAKPSKNPNQSKRICRRCNRLLENIEKGEKLKFDFASVFWKTRIRPIPSGIQGSGRFTSKYNKKPSQGSQDCLSLGQAIGHLLGVPSAVPQSSLDTTQSTRTFDLREQPQYEESLITTSTEDRTKDGGRVYHSARHSYGILHKLYEERNVPHGMSDMVLVIGDETFQVHRAVVAAASPFIRSLLISSVSDGIYSSVLLLSEYVSITSQTLDAIVGYIYKGSIEICRDNVEEVLIVAEKFQMEELKQFCLKYKADEGLPPRSQKQLDSVSQTQDRNKQRQWNKRCVPFGCKYCLQRFSSLDRHRRHRKTHEKVYHKHWINKITPSVNTKQSALIESPRYKLRSRIRKLVESRHGTEYVSQYCNQMCLGKSVNIPHTHLGKQTNGTYRCTQCSQLCTSRKSFKAHLKYVHGNKNPFECLMCRKDYPFQSLLKLHLQSHQTKRPHRCNTCNKTFKGKYALKAHQRLHVSGKQYPCEVCRKTFRGKRYLNVHIRQHTGDKPYECKKCNERFCHKYELEKHEKIHTGDVVAVQDAVAALQSLVQNVQQYFKCDHCGAGFFAENDLTSHLRTDHMIQTMPKSILGDNFFLDDW